LCFLAGARIGYPAQVGQDRDSDMRLMEIPPFPRKIEIRDLDTLYRARLSQTLVMWPDQAIPLLGYMCYPNNLEAREILQRTIRSWAKESEATPPTVPRGLGRIQYEWQHVTDIFHLYCDLIKGQHQARRGGPSIGKAITLAEANTKSRGTGAATLWKNWSTYKDVAHLVAAATLITAEARTRYRQQPFGPNGPSFNQLVPFQMTMLMPDLVLAVALEFERLGLGVVPHARTQPPTLNPKRLWRIPPDINVAPLPPPAREIRPQDLAVLNKRRAGNRGKGKVRKTTPVSG
jgi:hypothetical protein